MILHVQQVCSFLSCGLCFNILYLQLFIQYYNAGDPLLSRNNPTGGESGPDLMKCMVTGVEAILLA